MFLLLYQKHPDCLPILVLGEMISLTEGPLYTKIRGKGYLEKTSDERRRGEEERSKERKGGIGKESKRVRILKNLSVHS